jgi:hypothetical protein
VIIYDFNLKQKVKSSIGFFVPKDVLRLGRSLSLHLGSTGSYRRLCPFLGRTLARELQVKKFNFALLTLFSLI